MLIPNESDLNEHNYINKHQTEIDPLDDDDSNKDKRPPHENALVLAPGSSVLYWSPPPGPALLFSNIGKKKLLSCFSAIFLYKTSKLLDAQASPPKEVLKIQPKLLNEEPANFFCKRLHG